MNPAYTIGAVALVALSTVAVGIYGLRVSRTTSDFYVASRTVSPLWNASAIGGEYLSAASFLGVAGLILAYGVDMLWFPVGYTAGYLVLLVLIAAPLRRSGAYTLPDFAEARLESSMVRRVASVFVVLIGWLYLIPQLQGAGLTLRTVTGAPYWLGGLVVAAVVLVNVLSGGMRSITFVQAFQYWLKLTAIAVPVAFLLVAWRADGAPTLNEPDFPRFSERTTVRVQSDVTVRVVHRMTVTVSGRVDGQRHAGTRTTLDPGRHRIGEGTSVTFPAGARVPHAGDIDAVRDRGWSLPLSSGDHPLYETYSLILATFLGTMGLPHVLVRFYTNPDGRAARRTTLAVLGLLGLFYLIPSVYGALGRVYAPHLLMTGQTDAVVLVLPARLVGGLAGELLAALVAAGAFAAFLSTSSGLTVSVAGVLAQDLLRGGVRSFRMATILGVAVPFLLATATASLPIADVVGLAFAVAASSFCPLLVLGIWWRGLTDVGAAVGLLVGGGLASAAVVVTIVGDPRGGWMEALLVRPAAWSVPVAFLTMVLASLVTSRRVTPGVGRTMARLHAPEAIGLAASQQRRPPRLPGRLRQAGRRYGRRPGDHE